MLPDVKDFAERVRIDRARWVSFGDFVMREYGRRASKDFSALVRVLVTQRHFLVNGSRDAFAEVFADLIWQVLVERLPAEELPGAQTQQEQPQAAETFESAMADVKPLRR
jgi:hypothetical protein